MMGNVCTAKGLRREAGREIIAVFLAATICGLATYGVVFSKIGQYLDKKLKGEPFLSILLFSLIGLGIWIFRSKLIKLGKFLELNCNRALNLIPSFMLEIAFHLFILPIVVLFIIGIVLYVKLIGMTSNIALAFVYLGGEAIILWSLLEFLPYWKKSKTD